MATDLEQVHFRSRTDGDAADATPTWGAAEDVNYDPGASPFRLRIGLANVGDASSGSLALYLKKNSGSYAAITTSSTGGVQSYDASSDADNTPILIQRLSIAPLATTWNPADKVNWVLSGGDLTVTYTGVNAYTGIRSIMPCDAGQKVYVEHMVNQLTYALGLGFVLLGTSMGSSAVPGAGTPSTGFYIRNTGVFASYDSADEGSAFIPAWTTGDQIDIAFDTAAKLAWFRKNNGAWNESHSGTQDPASGQGGARVSFDGPYYPIVSADAGTNDGATVRFLSSSWLNAAPSGFTQINA